MNACMSNKLIVSVDVEDWYHGPTVINPQADGQKIEDFLASSENFERAHRYISECLDLLAARNIKATFFWVAEYAARFKPLLREVADAGHEIACHGLAHYSKLDRNTRRNVFTPEQFRARTLQAKNLLENMVGKPVIGYRAPNAYVTAMMVDALEELGFLYDSSVSVNSVYNKTDSPLRGVSTAPYYPQPGSLEPGKSPRGIIEYPWPYLELGGVKIPSAGGPFLRLLGSSMTVAGIRQSLRYGHTVFYFHPIDICREDIPLPFNVTRPLMWLFKGDLVKRRIERVLDAFAGQTTYFQEVLHEAVDQRSD